MPLRPSTSGKEEKQSTHRKPGWRQIHQICKWLLHPFPSATSCFRPRLPKAFAGQVHRSCVSSRRPPRGRPTVFI